MKNTLYYGDNLDILRRYIKDNTIDLIYLDPPFKSGRDYNVLFREANGSDSVAQIRAFEDTWRWDEIAARTYDEILLGSACPQKVKDLIRAFRTFLGESEITAYLVMMAVRLVELWRVLKPKGSIYLHCDPAASHYLKMVMDAVFGHGNFRNEIVWKRTFAHNDPMRYGRNTDRVLFYTKSEHYIINTVYVPYDPRYIERFYRYQDERGRYQLIILTGPGISEGESCEKWRGYDPKGVGRHWAVSNKTVEKLVGKQKAKKMGVLQKLELLYQEDYIVFSTKGVPRFRQYLHELSGVPAQELWDDISPVSSQSRERLGYPTQKPEALLDRILKASSNKGDLILDPFCGCGTAVIVAERLKRKWIGVDITHLAINLIKHRLHDTFGEGLGPYEVIGEPEDLAGARALAEEDPFQFQYWALGRADPLARPTRSEEKRGADRGIDGKRYFKDEAKKEKVILFSVKSGHVSVRDVRDLRGVMEREKAQIGVLITLEAPTRDMRKEAAAAGFYYSPWDNRSRGYPAIQILTVEDLFQRESVQFPKAAGVSSFKKAKRHTQEQGEQREMF